MTENQQNKGNVPEEPLGLTDGEIIGIALRVSDVLAAGSVTRRFGVPSPDCFPVAGEEEDPREITAMLAASPGFYCNGKEDTH